jgi:hypothetical protein
MRGLDESLLEHAAPFVLAGSVTTSLVTAVPVRGTDRHPQGVATAESVLRAQRNIRNEFLADFDLLADGLSGVEIQYLDARDPAPSPFAPLPAGVLSKTSPLQSAQGSILALVRVSALGIAGRDEVLRVRYLRVELVLGLLAVGFWTLGGGPRTLTHARLVLGATAGRALLLFAGPTPLPWPALAGPEVYSSGWLGPLLASPFDLLATAAWLALVATVVLSLAPRSAQGRPSLARLAPAVVAALLILFGSFLLIADTVAKAELDLGAITVVPQSPVHLALHAALLLILGAALLLLAAVFAWVGPLPRSVAEVFGLVLIMAAALGATYVVRPDLVPSLPLIPTLVLSVVGIWLGQNHERARAWLAHGDTGQRTTAVLGLTALLATLVYPSIVAHAEAGQRQQIESEYAPLVLEQPVLRARALEQSRETVDEMRLLENEADASLSAVDDLAFAVWSASELAETAASSAVEIQDARGVVISRFALSLPSLAASGPPQPLPSDSGWRTTRETITVATAERPVLHASRLLVYGGRTRGAIHLYVGEDLGQGVAGAEPEAVGVVGLAAAT